MTCMYAVVIRRKLVHPGPKMIMGSKTQLRIMTTVIAFFWLLYEKINQAAIQLEKAIYDKMHKRNRSLLMVKFVDEAFPQPIRELSPHGNHLSCQKCRIYLSAVFQLGNWREILKFNTAHRVKNLIYYIVICSSELCKTLRAWIINNRIVEVRKYTFFISLLIYLLNTSDV